MRKYRNKILLFVFVLCLVMAACSKKDKQQDKQPDKPQEAELQITEAVSEVVSEVIGNDETQGNTESVEILAKADFNGDGIEDSVCAKKTTPSGMMQELYLELTTEEGTVSVKVPESVTITCHQESGTEFQISCDGFSLGKTTLDEKPAYSVWEYLKKTMGMVYNGDSYEFTIYGDQFSMADAECHSGSAIWCRGYFTVEGKELGATWTLEYSLGKWILTSIDLPIWNLNGTNTGWGLGKGALPTMAIRNRYVGYLDESSCYQDFQILQDYDGDGTLDRIWKDRSDKVSYTIHFGNGEELLLIEDAAGDWFDCYVRKLTEDTTVLWCRESGMSTGGDWTKLQLFKQTDEGLVPMELPEGPTLTVETVSERTIEFYWNGQRVDSLCLDEIYSFAELTVEEWLENYTTEENGAHVLSLQYYRNAIEMEDGGYLWETIIGDKWGGITFAWNTRYTDGAWEITAVYRC